MSLLVDCLYSIFFESSLKCLLSECFVIIKVHYSWNATNFSMKYSPPYFPLISVFFSIEVCILTYMHFNLFFISSIPFFAFIMQTVWIFSSSATTTFLTCYNLSPFIQALQVFLLVIFFYLDLALTLTYTYTHTQTTCTQTYTERKIQT